MPRGGVDCAIKIEFIGRTLTGKTAQLPQRHLDVPSADFRVAVEVFEVAFLPNLHSLFVLRLTANAHAFRMVSRMTKRRGAARTDPLVAAFVALLLLIHSLFERFHELIPTAKLFDLGFFFLSQEFLVESAEPVFRNLALVLGQLR